MSAALTLVRTAYPGMLDSNQPLLFKLKCRQFVEMIGGYDEISVATLRLSCTSELGSSTDGTPPPRDVATPPSHDPGPPLSPQNNETSETSGSVFDSGEVGCITIYRRLNHCVPLFIIIISIVAYYNSPWLISARR